MGPTVISRNLFKKIHSLMTQNPENTELSDPLIQDPMAKAY
jgi:hypothetical protein